ncbi:glycosyltransferase [Streptomyces violascens]
MYGGAGVHAGELAKALRPLVDLRVHCFGEPRSEAGVTAYQEPELAAGANAALRTLGVNVEMAARTAGTDLVHSHTWYANAAGRLAQLVHGVPHVVTTHSLEPLRPWKAGQLGGSYALSSHDLFDRLIIFDRTTAFIPDPRHESRAALVIEHPAIVHYLAQVFDHAWRRAEPVAITEYQVRPPARRGDAPRGAASDGRGPHRRRDRQAARDERPHGLHPHQEVLRAVQQPQPGPARLSAGPVGNPRRRPHLTADPATPHAGTGPSSHSLGRTRPP